MMKQLLKQLKGSLRKPTGKSRRKKKKILKRKKLNFQLRRRNL